MALLEATRRSTRRPRVRTASAAQRLRRCGRRSHLFWLTALRSRDVPGVGMASGKRGLMAAFVRRRRADGADAARSGNRPADSSRGVIEGLRSACAADDLADLPMMAAVLPIAGTRERCALGQRDDVLDRGARVGDSAHRC